MYHKTHVRRWDSAKRVRRGWGKDVGCVKSRAIGFVVDLHYSLVYLLTYIAVSLSVTTDANSLSDDQICFKERLCFKIVSTHHLVYDP